VRRRIGEKAMSSLHAEVEWKGRTGPFSLVLGPGVFSPTATSKSLAEAIEISPGDTVIDVGCGSGVLAFVAAKLGAAKVYGVDLSQRAV
jgi:ribosomal protein L11 methyltransferase